MFQTDFFRSDPAGPRSPTVEFTSQVSPSEIEYVYFTRWEEHCLECSAPSCFDTCALYSKRADRMCARFAAGIIPNPSFAGPLGYGADISFKRWGKLQTDLKFSAISLRDHRKLAEIDESVLKLVRPTADLLGPAIPIRKINPHIVHNFFRNRLLSRYFNGRSHAGASYDAFLVEGFNPSPTAVRLNLEILQQDTVRYRSSLCFEPGPNLHRVAYADLNIDLTEPGHDYMFAIYPDDDAEVRLIFTWLDFVKFASSSANGIPAIGIPPPRTTATAGPAKKVKCVVWDLDNTVWSGTLLEDGPDRLQLRDHVAATITELDRRGILQSIASKNDHDLAWECVKRFGLDGFFLHPQINWRPKSESIRNIAAELSLGIDSFALIDDSAFERGEVGETLPELRVYAEQQIENLTGLSEFDVPRTEESGKRREMYLQEATRKRAAETYGGEYERFLQSCDLQVDIFSPANEAQTIRCYELIQRTNQLNSSGKRYSEEQFRALLHQHDLLPVAVSCADRFGNYGLVGYLSVRLPASSEANVEDFVLSCRVAGKKVEHALFNALRGQLADRGFQTLTLDFVATPRNGMMRNVLGEVGFREPGSDGKRLTMPTGQMIPWADIVSVKRLELHPARFPEYQ